MLAARPLPQVHVNPLFLLLWRLNLDAYPATTKQISTLDCYL